MGGPLTEACQYAVERLCEVGAPATADPAGLVLPGVLVMPQTLTFDTLGDTARTTMDVWAVGRGLGVPDLAALDALAQLAATALGARTWRVQSVSMPNHSADLLPCLQTTIETEWSNL